MYERKVPFSQAVIMYVGILMIIGHSKYPDIISNELRKIRTEEKEGNDNNKQTMYFQNC